MKRQNLKWMLVGSALLIAGCATGPGSELKSGLTSGSFDSPSRPQAEREFAQLMTFFGVERGMTAMDLGVADGIMMEVLSATVGHTGKVFAKYEHPAHSELPNVVRTNGALAAVPEDSVDVAIAFANLHDVYHRHPQYIKAGLKRVYHRLKRGGVFGVVDHVGDAGAANATLHRMTKRQAIDVLQTVGFVLEAESDLFTNPDDDHTRPTGDASIRGKTDRFTLKFRKPK